MILRLAIAQARAQKRYTIWTAAFIALALGLVSFSFGLIETQAAFDSLTSRASGMDGEHLGGRDVMTGSPPNSSRAASNTSTEAIDATLDAAIADGSDVVAARTALFTVVENPASHVVWRSGWAYEGSTSMPYVAAVRGPYPWDVVLAEGRAPRDGEIALSAALASDLGVGIGDPLLVRQDREHEARRQALGVDASRHTLVISGLLRSNVGLTDGVPWEVGALVTWDLSSEEGGLFTLAIGDPDEPDVRGFYGQWTWVSWEEPNAALATFFGDLTAGVDPMIFDRSVTVTVGSAYVMFALAGLLMLGSVIGAFAVGRSQGQIRVQWVATARTLGATQRSVRVASLAEAGLVAAVGTVIGLALGYGAATARLLWLRAQVEAPLAPTWVSLPWWVLGIIAGLGLFLAAIMGMVPAFWASRVAPVAAHKAMPDLAVVETSSRISTWWLLPGLLAGVAAIVAGSTGTWAGTFTMALGAIVTAPIAVLLLLECQRVLIPGVAVTMTKSRAPWVMSAGDALAARPRQGVTLALLASLAIATVASMMTLNSFFTRAWFLESSDVDNASWWDQVGGPLGMWTFDAWAICFLLLLPMEVIALAVTFSSLRATAAERATKEALGLTASSSRAAAGAQHAVPQAIGAIVGALAGIVIGLFVHFGTNINVAHPRRWSVAEYVPALYISLTAALLLLVSAAAVILAGSVFAARGPRTRTPVEALRQVG